MATHAARHPLRKCADEDKKPWFIDGVETEKLRQNNPLPLILSTPTPLILNTPNIFIDIPQWGVFDISGGVEVQIRGRGLHNIENHVRPSPTISQPYITIPAAPAEQKRARRVVHFGSHSL